MGYEMTKRDFTVRFHIILSIYFPPEQGLSGSEAAQLWKLVGTLGERPAAVSIACVGDAAPSEEMSFLGSVQIAERLLPAGQDLRLFGASVVRAGAFNAILDSDFNIGYDSYGVWRGHRTCPELILSISGELFQHIGSSTFLALAKESLRIADSHCPHYGLVDVAGPRDAYAGTVYGTTWPATAPIHRWIEQHGWVFSGSKLGDRARGLYWGNYFGPKILGRLGGRKSFLEEYRHRTTGRDGTTNSHIWEFTNGVFVSVCLDPLQWSPDTPIVNESNLLWLHRELGTKGVLNAW
jgi:hypothetical protein